MKTHTRVLSLVMAATLAFSVAGCGSDKKDNSGGPDADGKFNDVRLKMLVCWHGPYKTAPDQYNNDVAEEIRKKIGVTVEFEGTMKKETEQLNLMFASGDMPDIVNAPYWGGSVGETAIIKKAAAEDMLLPIEDELPNYENLAHAYDIGVISQSYLENDLEIESFNGHRYLLPQETPGDENAITNWGYGVFVRGDVPAALGIDASSIKTFDELYSFMEKAKEHGFKDVNGNKTIVATTFHEGWDYTRYVESFEPTMKLSADINQLADGSYTHKNLDDDYFYSRNLALWKMVKNGILDKECFKQTDSSGDQKVGNGTALFVASQYAPVYKATQKTGLYNNTPEMRYVPVGPMNYADGTPLKQPEANGRKGSPVLFFPKDCSNLDAALTYINFLNSKDGYILANYGFEGKTFDYNEEGQPRLAKKYLGRFADESEQVREELREFGVGYMHNRTLCGGKAKTWCGEGDIGVADAANPEEEAYKQSRPTEVMEGYPVQELGVQFKQYEDVSKILYDDTKERDYRERAYFADTEEEARKILKEYQDYLKKEKNGVVPEYIEYLNKEAAKRDDIVN